MNILEDINAGQVFKILVYLFCVILLITCKTEKDNHKQTAFAFAVIASNNAKACDPGPISSNIQSQVRSHSLGFTWMNCEDLENYKLDSREFRSDITNAVNGLSFVTNASIFREDKSLLFPVSNLLFGTKESVLLDEKGFKKNPAMYNYVEYRAVFILEKQIVGISEESANAALLNAIESCKRNFKNE